jgi:hypothetical protein
MKEEFIGTAILDRSLRPQELYLIGRRSNGRLFRDDGIPVYPNGSPKPSACAWMYEVHGNTLHVRPSVRIRLTNEGPDYFHNEGFWIIRFEDGRFEDLEEANKSILPQYAPKQVGAGIYEWIPDTEKKS